MSHQQNRGHNNVKHKSSADLKEKYLSSVKNKLGGEVEALRVSELWAEHKRAEQKDDRYDYCLMEENLLNLYYSRRKREADGFVRGLISAHNLSRNEAYAFLA